MAMLMGQSYWALVAQALPCCCFADVCLSPYWCEPFLRSVSLGQGAISMSVSLPQMFLFSIFHLRLYNQIQNSKFVIDFNFQSISYG
jgi:hypothetical protein